MSTWLPGPAYDACPCFLCGYVQARVQEWGVETESCVLAPGDCSVRFYKLTYQGNEPFFSWVSNQRADGKADSVTEVVSSRPNLCNMLGREADDGLSGRNALL
jgi:hypothetical protein